MAIARPPVVNPFANAASGSPDIAVPTYMDPGFPAPGTLTLGPPRGFINWLFNWCMQAGRYLLSRGIAEWDAAETQYQPGSVAFDGDFHYWMLMNGKTATTGTAPDADTTNWSRLNVRDRANLADYNKEAGVWRNYRGQRRNGFDYWGFLNGNEISWDENWDDPLLESVTASGQTNGSRWYFSTTGGGGGGGNLAEHAPQYITAVKSFPLVGITSITAGGRAELQRNGPRATAVFTDDVTAGMFWPFLLPATASANCTFIMGFNAGNTHVDNIVNGAYVYKSPTDVNWQFITVSGGVASTPVDTGIVAAGSGALHRAGLVLAGANQVDTGGLAKAILLIDGSIVGSITTHLPYTTGGAGAGLQLSPIFGIVTTATANAIELLIGPVRYRQNMFPGDIGVV